MFGFNHFIFHDLAHEPGFYLLYWQKKQDQRVKGLLDINKVGGTNSTSSLSQSLYLRANVMEYRYLHHIYDNYNIMNPNTLLVINTWNGH